MGSTGSFGPRYAVMQQAGGEGGAGGAGGAGGQQGGGQQGGQPFADAAAARTFLSESIGNADLVKVIGDDHAVPFATALKGRFDTLGKDFPGSWRELIAGGDKEHMKTLERFANPKALYDSYGALRQKISSGEYKAVTPFPDQGSDQDKSAWRQANGIPDKAEAYELKLPQGVVLGDEHKPVIEGFRKHAFERNLPPAAFNAAMEFYAKDVERVATERSAKDQEFMQASEDKLRAAYGNDYRANIGRMQAFLSTAPKGVADAISNARMPDGTLLGNHPDLVQFLVDTARTVNPAGVMIPGADGNLAQSVEAELKTIETGMKTDRSAYNKDEKTQARYRDLLEAWGKMNPGKQWGQG